MCFLVIGLADILLVFWGFLVTIRILQPRSESLKIHRAVSLLLFCKNQMGDCLV